jgi:tRNA 2-thiouridine synthesizing protein A
MSDLPEPDQVLDVKGLNCPMPVLRAKLVLDRMQPGQHLRVEATDPHSVPDFEAFCDKTGHSVVTRWEDEGVFGFLLRRR